MADDALATTQRLDSVLSALNHSLMRNGATGMGTSLDPYTQVEVNYGRLLNEQQLRALYRGSWFIRRVVDLLPQDMTKAGVEVLLHDGSNTRIVNKAMQVYHDGGQRQNPYEKRMGCNEARRLALTYARWFGMGYIVLRVNGGENPAKPLTKVKSFEGVSVLDRYSLRPAIGTIDVHNPEFYQVSRHDAPGGFGGELPVMQRIHASRVLPYKGAMIHPYDIQLEGDGGHDSVVQQVYEAFTRHFMAKDAISKGLDSYSLFKVAISGLSTLLQSPNGTQTLTEYLNTVAQQMSLHRILVQDTEASKSEFQERSFAGVAENFKFFVDDLIAATGYPHYKIYGSVGKAGLADSGGAESRAWAETVRAYQSMELADNDRILFHAIFEALGRVPKQWEVIYPSIYSATPEEEATLAKTQADTLTALTREGVITTRQAYQALATGQALENVLKPLDEADVLTPVEEEAAQGPSAEEELTALLGGAPAEPATPEAPPEGSEAVEDVPEEEAIDVAAEAEEEQQTDAADTFTPPKAAQRNAQRVLEWRERYGDEVKGMTAVGWTRARQLASGEPISLDTVKRMAQFNRHRQNRTVAPENKGTPWKDAGHVAWLGWGGTEGVDWAISVSRNVNDTTDLWDDHADAEDILVVLANGKPVSVTDSEDDLDHIARVAADAIDGLDGIEDHIFASDETIDRLTSSRHKTGRADNGKACGASFIPKSHTCRAGQGKRRARTQEEQAFVATQTAPMREMMTKFEKVPNAENLLKLMRKELKQREAKARATFRLRELNKEEDDRVYNPANWENLSSIAKKAGVSKKALIDWVDKLHEQIEAGVLETQSDYIFHAGGKRFLWHEGFGFRAKFTQLKKFYDPDFGFSNPKYSEETDRDDSLFNDAIIAASRETSVPPKPWPPVEAERLVLQAAKVIYGGFENWEVRGIRNLRLGVPLGGLTVEVVTVSDEGEVLRLEGVWNGRLWTDTLITESREDAAKKGGKGKRKGRTEKPKCTKGRVCGMTCIRRYKANREATHCRFDPPPVVAEALNQAAAMGGKGGGGAVPTSLPKDHVVTTNKRITAARLDKALNAIDSPGAKERVGMFRAFVAKTGVQTVFADPDASLTDHLAVVERGLKDQRYAAEDGGLLRNTKADPTAAGYTTFVWNHVVITSDSRGRDGAFVASSEKLRQAADRIFEANAEDELTRDVMAFPFSVSGSVRDRDSSDMMTYIHEMGHQVHAKAGLPAVPLTIKGSATNYGAVNEEEWFAEHFGLWMLDGQRYEQLDPAGAQFIRDSLVRATENPVSVDELIARRRA